MKLSPRCADAAAYLDGLVDIDVPLAAMTTYRVGGNAALLARAASLADLRRLAQAVATFELPVLIVGRGSNMLVADTGFDGLVITVLDWAEHIEFHGTAVRAGAAVALPVLARRTVAAGLTGFEWAVGVPGSIGGAVRMNAGGHGSDMEACLDSVQIFSLASGELHTRARDELGLRFRGSGLGDLDVVVEATLQLAAGDQARSEHELAEIVRWRRENQPGGQNAGSVFVNPIPGELSAGELIDRAGLRGMRIGGAFVSDKHANFIQAVDGATAADVRAVMEHVRTVVEQETGFRLRSEVRLVGFEDEAR